MSLIQIVIGVVVFIVVAVLWANAAKGVDGPRGFTDADKDGAPDATAHDKEATIALFKEHQVQLHPEDKDPS